MATAEINILATRINEFQEYSDEEWAQIEDRECSLIVALEFFLDIAHQLNDSDNYVIADDETNQVAYIIPEITEVMDALAEHGDDYGVADLLTHIKINVTNILIAFSDRKNCFDETIADFLAIDADIHDL